MEDPGRLGLDLERLGRCGDLLYRERQRQRERERESKRERDREREREERQGDRQKTSGLRIDKQQIPDAYMIYRIKTV